MNLKVASTPVRKCMPTNKLGALQSMVCGAAYMRICKALRLRRQSAEQRLVPSQAACLRLCALHGAFLFLQVIVAHCQPGIFCLQLLHLLLQLLILRQQPIALSNTSPRSGQHATGFCRSSRSQMKVSSHESDLPCPLPQIVLLCALLAA